MPRLSPSASSESVTLTASLGHCLRPGLSLICAHAHAHTLRHTHMPTPLSWPEAYLQRPGSEASPGQVCSSTSSSKDTGTAFSSLRQPRFTRIFTDNE